MTTKRIRTRSAEAAVQAMVNVASAPLQPPKHVKLRPQDEAFFAAVTRARARDEWIDVDLVVAVQLARCQADIESESRFLDEEGSTITNDRGTKVMNPRFSVLSQLASREMALMRSLRMTGRVAGDSRDVSPMRGLERRAAATQRAVAEEDDGLLAMP